MQDLHVATIKFLNPLLRIKQKQMARAAHTAEFPRLQAEFENLRHRLCLEVAYAIEADNSRGRLD